MDKIFLGALLLVSMVGPAAAQVAAVPAPDIGGGMLGMLVAAGAVYLIKRRGR